MAVFREIPDRTGLRIIKGLKNEICRSSLTVGVTCMSRAFSKTEAAGHRRQLLGAGHSATAAGSLASSSNHQAGQAAGQSGRRAVVGGLLGVDATAAQPSRYMGPVPSRNKIIGGLFLHTTHKSHRSSCNGEKRLSSPLPVSDP
jgi:hypothetical protein